MALVAPEKIVSLSALSRERIVSMFMALQFNVAGESYSSEWLSC